MHARESETDPDGKPFLVVAGSAESDIDALVTLVAGLPADFGAPIIIAQQSAPTDGNRLPTVLAGQSALPVRTVSDVQERLTPGTIYLVGHDCDLEVSPAGETALISARRVPSPSIDRLFATAAGSFGEHLIGIIYAGMGPSGYPGAHVVRENGGIVMVQDPASAGFSSKPIVIPPSIVDFVARPEVIPQLIRALVSGAILGAVEQEADELRAFLMQIRDRTGIDFSQYKPPTIMRRLARLMIAAGVRTLDEYIDYIAERPTEVQRIVNAFLIKVTKFFRDASLFEYLRISVVPRLIEEARASGSELRIWSAGTSTGEEAYSLAILCAELLRNDSEPLSVRIFATDVDENAIAFARRGVYSADALRKVPKTWVDRYFIGSGETFEVGKRIRNMTVFGQHDLAQRAPFPRIDLCLCRNVLIYFTKELQVRALQLFAFCLRQNGVLVLGKAESTGSSSHHFRILDSNLKVYQREGERIVIPPARLIEAQTDDRLTAKRRLAQRATITPRSAAGRASASELYGATIDASPVGIVLVDRRYDIIAINATARAMLEVHGIGIGDDLIHSVRSIDAVHLRSLIDATFRGDPVEVTEMPSREIAGDVDRWFGVTLTYAPSSERHTDFVGIVIVDVTEIAGRRRRFEREAIERDAALAEVSARLDDLLRRQRQLLGANDELVTANAELRSLNEQLLVNSEEAASSNEEIETLNEEMQATNEELETLNEELQATVEELNTTNDELEARSGELEAIARQREAEIERVRAERRAIATAFSAVVDGPFAIIEGEGSVIFASDSLGGANALAAQMPQWWRRPTLRLGDRSYDISTQVASGTSLTLVVLQDRST